MFVAVETIIGGVITEKVHRYTANGETALGHEPGSKNWHLKLVNTTPYEED